MDMSNIHVAPVVIDKIDTEILNNAIKNRAVALASQLPADAAAQYESDMSSMECIVSAEGNSIKVSTQMAESYLINYLKNHGTPVSGGDGGTAHNVDGSTYQSRVPTQLQGTPLPNYELPHVDGETEVEHIVEIMAPDMIADAINRSHDEIGELVKPALEELISSHLGGG